MNNNDLTVSAPGRICLFGEHQDYFGLSIIAAAINRRITIQGKQRTDGRMDIQCPDVQESDSFLLDRKLAYEKSRDYIRSTVNVLQRSDVHVPQGWSCMIRGTIPINSGTASSSALVVAWAQFLLEAGNDPRAHNPHAVAELAFDSEVAEFGEPGGKMDHYAAALGGVVFIHFGKKLEIKPLQNPLKTFVLADSMQRKNTTGTLGLIKSTVHRAISHVQEKISGFDVHSKLGPKETEVIAGLPEEEQRFLLGTLRTRNLTRSGLELFQNPVFDHARFADLLNRQQDVLREDIGVSTPRIDRLLDAALDAGALGGKINGSGMGGCLFVYTPEKAEGIAETLNSMGAKAHIVHVDSGVRTEYRTI